MQKYFDSCVDNKKDLPNKGIGLSPHLACTNYNLTGSNRELASGGLQGGGDNF